MTFQSLVQAVLHHETAKPGDIAIISGGREITYSRLAEMVRNCASRLLELGLKQGQGVIIHTAQDASFIACYLAVHHAGGIAIPIERESSEDTVRNICDHAAVGLVISDTASFVQKSEESGNRSIGFPEVGEISDILFTTGTTGRSKGVMVSHRAWMANADNLTGAQGYVPEDIFITTGPLNHIGNLSKIYATLACGGTLYILEGMKDTEAFWSALDYRPERKKATFLVPASIRILTHLSGTRLSSYSDRISFVETGAAPISRDDMQTLARLLPKSRLFNTYASTETGIISTYQYNDGKCLASCTGKAMKNSRILIVDENRKEILSSPDNVGHIACQGATLMSGYAGEPEMTASIMEENTLFTQDLGYMDENGYLILGGRDGDVINVGGYKISPEEVENAAMSNASIRECICIGASHPIMGNVLKLLIVPEDIQTFSKRELALYLKSRLEAYKVPMYYEVVTSIKRTFNGKPDRKAYR